MGCGDHRLGACVGLVHQFLLNHGDAFDRDLNAQIAPRHHDAVGGPEDCFDVVEGLGSFDLGDDEWIVAQCSGGLPDLGHVVDRRHEGLADGIDPLSEGKLEALAIPFREGADAEVHSRQVDALAGSQFSAGQYAGEDVRPVDAEHFELDGSVGEEDPIPWTQHGSQSSEPHGNPLLRPDDIIGGQEDAVVRFEFDW